MPVMPVRPMLLQYGPRFFLDSFVKNWATREIFLGKWFPPPPPPGKKFPYAYAQEKTKIQEKSRKDAGRRRA